MSLEMLQNFMYVLIVIIFSLVFILLRVFKQKSTITKYWDGVLPSLEKGCEFRNRKHLEQRVFWSMEDNWTETFDYKGRKISEDASKFFSMAGNIIIVGSVILLCISLILFLFIMWYYMNGSFLIVSKFSREHLVLIGALAFSAYLATERKTDSVCIMRADSEHLQVELSRSVFLFKNCKLCYHIPLDNITTVIFDSKKNIHICFKDAELYVEEYPFKGEETKMYSTEISGWIDIDKTKCTNFINSFPYKVKWMHCRRGFR